MNSVAATLDRVETLSVTPDAPPDASWLQRWIDQIYRADRAARPLNSFELDRFKRSCRKDYRDDAVGRQQLLEDHVECSELAERFAAMGLNRLVQRARARAEVAGELAQRAAA